MKKPLIFRCPGKVGSLKRLFATILTAAGLSSTALPASAQSLPYCKTSNAGLAAEVKSKTFANGKIVLTLLDAGTPSHGAKYVRVEWPPVDTVPAETCRILGFDDTTGFAAVYFDDIKSAYDPSKGLTLSVPALFVLPQESFLNTMLVHMTINQATGEISTETELGND